MAEETQTATVDEQAEEQAAEQASTPEAEPQVAPTPKGEAKYGFWWGTGRRKTSVARVRIRPKAKDEAEFIVNGRQANDFFPNERDRTDIASPLKVTHTEGALDVFVQVQGGGVTGQAGATLLGLSRALKQYDPSLEAVLRDNEMLTVDARQVERKKYGQPGARRRFQFSKR